MQVLILKSDPEEFRQEVNEKLAAGYRMVGGVTVGTTSRSVSLWEAFPSGRVYSPVYSVVLDDGNKAVVTA